MSIDRRIVDMEFNNKQFERGVKTTVNSLDDLKKGLDLSASAKNLQTLQKQGDSFSLANISDGVQKLTERFSTLGIIGGTAIVNLTQSAINLGKKLNSAIMGPITEGGKRRALNIEQAKFQFEGLGMSIEETMADADYAVSGTAYSLDAAAKVASQLGASGMRAGEDMRNSLRAISGVAAMAGSSYEDIGNVFTKVAGQGRLMGDDLLRLSSRGINAAATIAKHLNKTEAQVRDMVTKGKIDFKIFSEAMDDAFGEHATAANKTFTGSLSNMRSALARIGEKFYTPFHANLIQPLNNLRTVINEVNSALTPAFDKLSAFMEISSKGLSGRIQNFDTGFNQILSQGIIDASEFKKVLKDVAGDAGIRLEQIENDTMTFEQSLKTGWMTSEMLGTSIDRLSKKYSVMSDEELKNIGVTREQVDQFNELRRSMKSGGGALSEWIDKFERSSGVRNIVEGISNAVTFLGEVLKPIKDAWSDIFPSKTNEYIYQATVRFKEFTEQFKVSDEVSSQLRTTFKGLFSIIDTGKVIFTAFFNSIKGVAKTLTPAGTAFLNFTSSVGEMLLTFNEAVKETGIFATIFEGVSYVFKNAFGIITKAISVTMNTLSDATNSFKDSISFSWFEALGNVLTMIGNAFRFVGGKIKEMVQATDLSRLKEYLDIGVLLTFAEVLRRMIVAFDAAMSKMFGILSTPKMMNKVFAQLRNSLIEFQTKLKMEQLKSLAISIGILVGAIWVLSTINPDRLAASLGAMTATIGSLLGSLKIMSKIDLKKVVKTTGILTGLATSVLILSFAMKNISSLDTSGIAKSLISITTLLGALIGFLWAIPQKKIVKGSKNLIQLSVALLIMSYAMKNIASMSWEGLAKGIIGLGVILGALIGFLWGIPKKKVVEGALNLVILSTALLLLTRVAKNIASMSWEGLAKAGAGIVGALGIIIGFLWGIPKGKVVQGSLNLVILSTALLIMTKVAQNLASMSWEGLGKAGAGLAGGLGIIIGFLWGIPKGIAKKAASFLIVSISLLAMTKALTVMGNMPWENIGKAGVVLAGSLALIAGGLHLMNGALPGAAALLVVTAALALLTPVLLALGAMSLPTIGKSLLMLAGVFTVIGVSALVLGPIVPVIFALGGALLVLGAGVTLAGVGVLALGAGLTALAAAFAASGSAIFSVIKGLLNLIPMLFEKLADGIVEFVKGIGRSAATIATAIGEVLVAVLDMIIESTPKIMETVKVILTELLDLLIEITPKIVDTTFLVLNALLDALIDFIPKLIDGGIKLLQALLDGLGENIKDIASSAVKIVTEFIEAIGEETPKIIDAGFQMIIDFINGLAESIRENTPLLVESIGNLMTSLVDAAVEILFGSITNFFNVGVDIVKGLIDGIKSIGSDIGKALGGFVTSGVDKVKKLLGIESPSKVFITIGEQLGQGMMIGIKTSSAKAVSASEDMANEIVAASKKPLKDFEKWLENHIFYNTITLEQQLAAWELFLSRQSSGSENALKAEREVYKKYKELAKDRYDKSMEWISEQKEESLLSLEQELEAYRRMQAEHMWGTEERKQIDKNYRATVRALEDKSYNHSMNWIQEQRNAGLLSLEDQLEAYRRLQKEHEWGTEKRKQIDKGFNETLQAMEDETYNNSLNWIQEKRDANELSMQDELLAYIRMQNRYEKGSAKRIAIDKQILKLQKDIKTAKENHEKEMAAIRKQGKDERIQAEEEYYNKVKEINDKLKDEVQSLKDEYDNAISSRTKELYGSYGLFDKVDPKAEVKGAELMKNLEDQVEEFSDWQETMASLSGRGINEGLIKELQDMGPDAIAQVKALDRMTDSQLAAYVTTWSIRHKQAKEQATTELEWMKIETQGKINQLNRVTDDELSVLYDTWQEKMDDINRNTRRQLKELSDNFETQVTRVHYTVVEEVETMNTNAINSIKEKDWEKPGKGMMDGIVSGIKKGQPAVIAAVVGVGGLAMTAFGKTIGWNSPAKEFIPMGQGIDEGIVAGINSYKNRVKAASEGVAEETIQTLGKSMSKINQYIESDAQPTIRPVLDLTDVSKGLGQVDSDLVASRSLALSAVAAYNQNGNKDSLLQTLQSLSDKSNGKLITAIQSLKGDFSELVSIISGMQIVMDTGSLVGAISPEMDRSLGTLNKMARRGVR